MKVVTKCIAALLALGVLGAAAPTDEAPVPWKLARILEDSSGANSMRSSIRSSGSTGFRNLADGMDSSANAPRV